MKALLLACLAAIAFGGCGGDSNSSGPHLSKVDPSTAAISATVTLTGTGFCGAGGGSACGTVGGQVEIGLAQPVMAAVEAYSDTSIEIIIPPNVTPGPSNIFVTVNGESSNALDFTVTAD